LCRFHQHTLKEVIHRNRTTWHETLGNAALFSFSGAVPDESSREGQTSLRAIALIGRPISIIVTALVAGGAAALKPMTEQSVMEASLD
jgi:hypothetical protein